MIGRTTLRRPTSAIPSPAERRIAAHTETLLDHYLPEYEVSEHHSISVDTSPSRAYDAVLSAPLGSSAIVRILLKLRGLPSLLSGKGRGSLDAASATLLDTIGHGFFLVDEQPGREIVLGTIGKFWRPTGSRLCGTPEDLFNGPPPGSAAAIWNFRVVRLGRGSGIHTETRVKCGDEAALRSFQLYWKIVGPFSGLIRRRMLAAIKREAESGEAAFL